jgi:glycosyltransferase involved in cell wall biosynthesis
VPAVGVVADGWMAYGPQVDPWTRWRRRLRLDPGIADAARWLFISQAVRDRAGVAGEVVHPGVDADAFTFRAPGPWRWRLACVGRVEPRKGVAVAVEALTLLPQEAVLTVDGPDEGDHAAQLRALASRLGVAGRVRFTRTPTERVAEAYAAADAVLFPVTWAEPWGLVPLEAMSVGRPVVATGTGGSAEYLRDGHNALVVAPGDARALAAAIRRLEDDRALRERLVGGGRATAARWTQAQFERDVIGALESVLHGVMTRFPELALSPPMG